MLVHIGYGETFVNQIYDFILAFKNGEKVKPDFKEDYRAQQVVEAVYRSAKNKNWEEVL